MRSELLGIILGTVFLSFGLAALLIAAIRDRRDVLIFVWLGIWSGGYGTNLLLGSSSVLASLPPAVRAAAPFVRNVTLYFLLVFGLLAWSELTVGKGRVFLRVMTVPAVLVGVTGLAMYLVTGSHDRLLPQNNFLAAVACVVLVIVVVVPKLSERYLTTRSPVLAAGSLIFAADALYRNLAGTLHWHSRGLPWMDELGFAAFLSSFGYVAARKVFASERRLVAIESELEVARKIQTSILPATTSQVEGLRVVAVYEPMTAIGGDFYDFIPVDANRIGLLVADVAGHGVPAALIASMIKVGVQSVVPCATDPAAVLGGLNRILCSQLRGMLVSAAYLWVDRRTRKAAYSAAGHPPLLLCHDGSLERIESNGLLFGVVADASYPVREIPLRVGDRFLLCTDGALEPENAAGMAFGDSRLEQVLLANRRRSPDELSAALIAEIAQWQPKGTPQQDDITFLIVDVV